MFSEDQGFLGFGSCFQRTNSSGSWLMFSEDQQFWILAHVFRGLGFLDLGSCFQRTNGFLGFGSCFQRPRIFGSWLMFSEDQEFFGLWLILAHVFRGPRIFGLWLMFLEDQGFLDFGSCFQRTKGSGSWLMFSET